MIEDRKKWLNEYFALLLNPKSSRQNKDKTRSMKLRRLLDLKCLYRYMDVQKTRKYVIKPLRDSKILNIRPSHPSKFNDPFDTRLPLEYFKYPKMRLQYVRGLHNIICEYLNSKSDDCDKCWAEFEKSLDIVDISKWKSEIANIFLKYLPYNSLTDEQKDRVIKKIENFYQLFFLKNHNLGRIEYIPTPSHPPQKKEKHDKSQLFHDVFF